MPNDDPAFAPEPATRTDSCRLGRAVGGVDWKPRSTRWPTATAGRTSETEALAQVADRTAEASARRRCERLRAADGAVLKTRVHGDFHLGQVLVAQGDAVIVDFEGEPAREPRRTARQDLAVEGRRRTAAQFRLRRRDAADGERDGRHAVAGTAPAPRWIIGSRRPPRRSSTPIARSRRRSRIPGCAPMANRTSWTCS